MAQASNLRSNFGDSVLLTAGSAFALAQYTEDHVRAGDRKPRNPAENQLLPGMQRLEGSTRLLRSSAIEVQML